jgi:hypothetical protein
VLQMKADVTVSCGEHCRYGDLEIFCGRDLAGQLLYGFSLHCSNFVMHVGGKSERTDLTAMSLVVLYDTQLVLPNPTRLTPASTTLLRRCMLDEALPAKRAMSKSAYHSEPDWK